MAAKTICVVGASGLVGSYITKTALARGYQVHGTFRDVNDPAKADYLKALPHAEQALTLYSADMADPDGFDEALKGCDAVVIACLAPIYQGIDGTPASELDESRGWNEIIEPIRSGCLNIMRAAARQNVSNVLICSSTSSTNPPFPVAVKNEIDHCSDLDDQLRQKKYVAAEKIVMETAAQEFAQKHQQRLSIFLPTMMLGPVLLPHHLQQHCHKLMVDLLNGRSGWHKQVPAGSMSVSHLQDVADLFLAALENPEAEGRYFAVYESWPWQDLYKEIAKHVPSQGLPASLDGEPEVPTGFDFTRRDSLGVAMRDIPTTLAQTFDWLKTNPFNAVLKETR